MPPPQNPAPTACIDLTLQGNLLTRLTPRVRLNGYPVQVKSGLNQLPVPPGPWRVEIDCQWMRTYGQAAIDVQLQGGQRVPVFYAAPPHQWARGNIGFTKQPMPHAWFLWVSVAVVLLSIILIVLTAG